MAYINTPEFIFDVYGVAVSVAEMGELISWLGAALRTSPLPTGLMYCKPILHNYASNIGRPKTSRSFRTTYKIEYTMKEIPQALTAANGQCWHNILRNPVVVRGYPIPQRIEWNTGLEISLNIMAGLAHTQRLDMFKEKTYIKGFSTMLFPTKKNKDIICWHLIYNKNGDRISYLDDDRNQEECIGQIDLENYRHVLGWCSEAKVYAGKLGLLIFPAIDNMSHIGLQRFGRSASSCNSLQTSQASYRLFSFWIERFRRKDDSERPSI
jgi:hypothetical protein